MLANGTRAQSRLFAWSRSELAIKGVRRGRSSASEEREDEKDEKDEEEEVGLATQLELLGLASLAVSPHSFPALVRKKNKKKNEKTKKTKKDQQTAGIAVYPPTPFPFPTVLLSPVFLPSSSFLLSPLSLSLHRSRRCLGSQISQSFYQEEFSTVPDLGCPVTPLLVLVLVLTSLRLREKRRKKKRKKKPSRLGRPTERAWQATKLAITRPPSPLLLLFFLSSSSSSSPSSPIIHPSLPSRLHCSPPPPPPPPDRRLLFLSYNLLPFLAPT
ncbi:hypothetical protein Dda_1171 [Drechslerella dactyloides]|uniref:Uncharacterized protein n=1 Tax=Drechslerella dactyloides TaxID=74499 RepID=A0AAD6NMR9_DREDA|nr:hypothetical protein Dda_1171 [Drechslerella dactyloides]